MKNNKHSEAIPDWVKTIFLHHYSSLSFTVQMITLYEMGIFALKENPDSVEKFMHILIQNLNSTPDVQPTIPILLRQVYAKRRIVLFELRAKIIITLWGDLERFILTFMARWLENEPNVMKLEVIRKLKVEVGIYEAIAASEKFEYLVSLLEDKLKSKFSRGASRFENLLAPFELSGAVDERIRKNLFEMQQVRNVWVHRQGIADKRLVETCPWLNLESGDTVIIRHRTFMNYYSSVVDYSLAFQSRVWQYFGEDMANENLWEDFIQNRRPEWRNCD